MPDKPTAGNLHGGVSEGWGRQRLRLLGHSRSAEFQLAHALAYDANRRGAAIAAEDPSVIGTSIDQRTAAGEFDGRMQIALGMWNLINEKIPAPILKYWREIGVLLDAPPQLIH